MGTEDSRCVMVMGWGFEFIEALMLGGGLSCDLGGWCLDLGESYVEMVVWKSSKLMGGRKSNEGGVGEFAFSGSPKLKRLSLDRSCGAWRAED